MNKEISLLILALKDAFQKQYAKLAVCLEEVMPTFAKNLYEKELISRPVMRSENYDKIVNEFLHGLQFIPSYQLLEKRCHLFIKVLREMGGATMNGAAQHLSRAWTKAAKTCGFDFQLPSKSSISNVKGLHTDIVERKTKKVIEATKQQNACILRCKCDLPAKLRTAEKDSVNKGICILMQLNTYT